MSNGVSGELDDLPEPVRRFAKEHQSWSIQALRIKWRIAGEDETKFLSDMEFMEEQRRLAYYRELGFTIDPKTGESLN